MSDENGIEKQYSISVYQEEFIEFLRIYGAFKKGEYLKLYEVSRGFFNQPTYYLGEILINNKQAGWLKVEFETKSDGQVIATIALSPLIPAKPLTKAMLQYWKNLDKTIHRVCVTKL